MQFTRSASFLFLRVSIKCERSEKAMKTSHFIAPLSLILVIGADQALAQEWTRFRGPNGTGVSYTKSIPTKVTERDIAWKIELPGTGHSSPVLWGEQIFLTTTGDKSGGISVLALSATTGDVIWKRDFSLTPFTRHDFNSFASATPAV